MLLDIHKGVVLTFCDNLRTISVLRYWAKGAAIVTCLLGVTWVFGVFFLNSDSIAVAYIFNICNVLQVGLAHPCYYDVFIQIITGTVHIFWRFYNYMTSTHL